MCVRACTQACEQHLCVWLDIQQTSVPVSELRLLAAGAHIGHQAKVGPAVADCRHRCRHGRQECEHRVFQAWGRGSAEGEPEFCKVCLHWWDMRGRRGQKRCAHVQNRSRCAIVSVSFLSSVTFITVLLPPELPPPAPFFGSFL